MVSKRTWAVVSSSTGLAAAALVAATGCSSARHEPRESTIGRSAPEELLPAEPPTAVRPEVVLAPALEPEPATASLGELDGLARAKAKTTPERQRVKARAPAGGDEGVALSRPNSRIGPTWARDVDGAIVEAPELDAKPWSDRRRERVRRVAETGE